MVNLQQIEFPWAFFLTSKYKLICYFSYSQPVRAPCVSSKPSDNWFRILVRIDISLSKILFTPVSYDLSRWTGVAKWQGSRYVMMDEFGTPTRMDGIIAPWGQRLLGHMTLRHGGKTAENKGYWKIFVKFLRTFIVVKRNKYGYVWLHRILIADIATKW